MFESKLRASKWIILLYGLSASALADPFFNNNTSSGYSSPSKAPTSPIVSPNDYKSKVMTLHQQNTTMLQGQYSQQYGKSTGSTATPYATTPPASASMPAPTPYPPVPVTAPPPTAPMPMPVKLA